jgi:hypothetical protein
MLEMLKRALYQVAKAVIGLKWFLLSDYYVRLSIQARYLYKQSSLFKDRWQQIGLDYAEQSFDDDLGGIGRHFFWKAQHSPWPIKKRIILDWVLDRPARSYAISDNGI